jgi:DNA replication and repair protein RecF
MNMVFCQVIEGYAAHLSAFSQTITRRNALLKQLAERGGDQGQLDFWDEKLAQHGLGLMQGRAAAITEINRLISPIHARLTAGSETLQLVYLPSVGDIHHDPSAFTEEEFRRRLRANHRLDIQRGVTTLGPHRDDLQFTVDGLDLSAYGSRGQVRTALQSLKLAEVAWMKERTGSSPVLLLDETLAELDENRRRDLLVTLGDVEQALLTTTDLDLFTPEFLSSASRWEIEAGRITRLASSAAVPPPVDTPVESGTFSG